MDDDEELQALRKAAIQSMLNKKDNVVVRENYEPQAGPVHQSLRQEQYNGHHHVPPLPVPYPHFSHNRHIFHQQSPFPAPYYDPQMPHFGPFPGPAHHHYYQQAVGFRQHRFPIHRQPHRHPMHRQNHQLIHPQPPFVNQYTNNERSSVIRNERRTGSPSTGSQMKDCDPVADEEKRLPGRFSRIDRSDSESEEDDRLDEFIDSDLDEDHPHHSSDAEERTCRSPEMQPSQSTSDEPHTNEDNNVESNSKADDLEADLGNEKGDDALSDLEVPDTDAITFEVDEDDDLEATLNGILSDKKVSPVQSPAKADCKTVVLNVESTDKSPNKELKRSATPQPQLLDERNAANAVKSEEAVTSQVEQRKTIRLKQSSDEDPLERRKRKFGLTDAVAEKAVSPPPARHPEKASRGWGRKGDRNNVTVRTSDASESGAGSKRIRSFVVIKK